MYHPPSHLHIVLVHIGDIFYTPGGHTPYRTYNLSYVQVQKASNAYQKEDDVKIVGRAKPEHLGMWSSAYPG